MKSLKKSILCILFAMVLFFSVFALMGFTTSTVNASTKDIFTAEDYTSNDRLLKEDGSLSTKEIVDFSNEVKVASNGVSFPELTQVIPSQILENGQETVSQYYGKEYGYYVVKEGDYVDVLLLDFEYEFDDGEEHSNEYIIKIKPLLQQRFLKFYNEGQCYWLKEKNFYKYYVANPRFFISLKNENSLNYGDLNYTKAGDKGAAIVQTRLNYGKVSYKDEEDFLKEGLKITGKKLLDYAIKAISQKFPLVSIIKDAISNNLDIYKQGQEQIVIADNEGNIVSLPEISNQHSDSQYLSYCRTAAFLPEDEIILSADENSYADYIVRIDEPEGGSCISRLDQICEFDIVRRNGNYSSMEHVAGNWYDENAQSLQFSKQRILFEDQEPEFKVTEENVEGDNIPVYLLPNGKQTIAFKPDYSAYYKFDLEDSTGLNLSVIDTDGNAVKDNGYYDLKGGENYNIIVTSGDEKAITSLGISLVDGKSSGTVYAKEQRLVKLNISQSDVYNLSTNNSTVTFEGIDITNDEELTFNWVQTDDLATIYYEVSNGTISCNGSVDTTGYVVGNTYGEDLTQYLSSFGISNVTITISKIDVTTSKGAMAVNLKTPFTAKVHMAYGSGSGTKNNPYIISCNRHFENMGINTDADTYFTITKYLKLEGNVIEDFYGIIESKDLVVISWTPEDKQKMGIIINNSGTIRNLQVNVNYNFNLTGLWGHTVGGIVCNNEDSGLIENCSVTMIRASKLNHTTTVGGIAGINNGTINNCYATVDVITGGTFGGIAGINYGTITDSCGMGDIVQKVETYEGCYELSYVGGIAGVNGAGGEISNCVGGTRDDSYLYVIIDVANVDDANLAPYSGPIAGENKGTVKDCSNYGYAIRTGNLHTGSNYNQLRNINNII